MRVLLIEDDGSIAQSIEFMLKSESFNVYTTDLGEEGVDLGRLYDYDIILLDLNLPDMSGFEVLRSLRVLPAKNVRQLSKLKGSREFGARRDAKPDIYAAPRHVLEGSRGRVAAAPV
jgi:CheY-like chemotaxis protein